MFDKSESLESVRKLWCELVGSSRWSPSAADRIQFDFLITDEACSQKLIGELAKEVEDGRGKESQNKNKRFSLFLFKTMGGQTDNKVVVDPPPESAPPNVYGDKKDPEEQALFAEIWATWPQLKYTGKQSNAEAAFYGRLKTSS